MKQSNKKNIDILKRDYKKIPVIKTVNGIDYLGGYIDKQGIYHPIPLYEKIKIPNKKENNEEILLAEWLKKEMGGNIGLVPTIEAKKGTTKKPHIKTPDILWNGERWDFKGIDGNSKHTIKRKFNDYKNQTDNLIIFHRKTDLTDKKIISYIEKAFKYYGNNYKSVIYIRDYKIQKKFKK